MNSDIAQLQANILFWIIIALFAWQGYQRGIWSELAKLAFIAGGFLLGSPQYLGPTLVRAINGFFLAALFLIHGGLKAIATGNFDADTLSKIFDEIGKIPKPISQDNMALALFLVMLFLIGLGYIVSNLFKKKEMPGMGLVIGALNGFLLSYIFLPLLPKKAPFTLSDLSPAGIIEQLAALLAYVLAGIFQLFAAMFDFMNEVFGAWSIPLLILIIIAVALSSLTQSKKKSSSGGGG